MNRLEEIISTLKKYIGEGVEAALEFLEKVLDHSSNRYNDFIQIKSRYNSLQRELLLGVIDHGTYDISRNNISKALLLLSDEITEQDLIPEGGVVEEKEDKRGEVLYHVPDVMQLNHEEKCTVRIAFDVEQVLQDWEKSEADVIKSIRVSEIMAVSLMNVDESDPPFAIRSFSETVQFLDKDEFTEWVFYVKPIKTGRFPLVLRVSVIEMINNKEYKKDIVLEEEITVQSEAVPPAGTPEFKSAGTGITLSSNPLPVERGAPAVAEAQEAGKKGVSRVAAGILATAAIAAASFFGVQYYWQEQAWKDAVNGTGKGGYEGYLKKYPHGRHGEEARIMIDSLSRADSLPGNSVLPPESGEPDNIPDTTSVTTVPQSTLPENTTPTPAGNTKPKPSAKKPAPKNDKSRPAPPVNKPPANSPSGTPSKPEMPAPASAPLLRGNNFYFKIPRFPVVETDNQAIDLKFYQFNQYREALLVLGSVGDVKFQPGMRLAFLPEKGDALFADLKYVASIPQAQNRQEGYFTFTGDELNRLAKDKFKSIRLIGADNQPLKVFNIPRSGSKNINRRAEDALKQLEEKK